jgi:hypothetical protein
MVILTPIERETFQVFKGKARAHSCPDLLLGDSSNKYSRQLWYADTRVERDGLLHRCLPYYQRWTHWTSVKHVKKTWRIPLSIGIRITMICCIVYLLRIFKMFYGLMNNPVLHTQNVLLYATSRLGYRLSLCSWEQNRIPNRCAINCVFLRNTTLSYEQTYRTHVVCKLGNKCMSLTFSECLHIQSMCHLTLYTHPAWEF